MRRVSILLTDLSYADDNDLAVLLVRTWALWERSPVVGVGLGVCIITMYCASASFVNEFTKSLKGGTNGFPHQYRLMNTSSHVHWRSLSEPNGVYNYSKRRYNIQMFCLGHGLRNQ